MNIINVSLTLLLVSLQSTSYAGGEVNNGGGSAEHNFAVAYQNLEKFITYCLGAPRCSSNSSERNVLEKVSASMPEERATKEQLYFLSGSSINPNPFLIDGAVRVAKTGDAIGSKIWLNLDLIYPKDHLGRQRAMTVGEAVAILVHEFGHHHSIANHQFLDGVGAKVRDMVENAVTQVWLHSGRISMTTINFYQPVDSDTRLPSFMVYDRPAMIIGGHATKNDNGILVQKESFFDLAQELSESMKCPHPEAKLDGFNIQNFRWKRGKTTSLDDVQVLARLCVIKRCPGDPAPPRSKTQTYEIDLRFSHPRSREQQVMKYKKHSLRIKKVQDWLPCPHDT